MTDSDAWLVPPELLEPATMRQPEDERVGLKPLPLVDALQLMLLLAEVPSRESRYQLRTLHGQTAGAEWSSRVPATLKAGCPLRQRLQYVHGACKDPWWQRSTRMGREGAHVGDCRLRTANAGNQWRFEALDHGQQSGDACAELLQEGLDDGLGCLPVQQGSVEQLAGCSIGVDANGG